MDHPAHSPVILFLFLGRTVLGGNQMGPRRWSDLAFRQERHCQGNVEERSGGGRRLDHANGEVLPASEVRHLPSPLRPVLLGVSFVLAIFLYVSVPFCFLSSLRVGNYTPKIEISRSFRHIIDFFGYSHLVSRLTWKVVLFGTCAFSLTCYSAVLIIIVVVFFFLSHLTIANINTSGLFLILDILTAQYSGWVVTAAILTLTGALMQQGKRASVRLILFGQASRSPGYRLWNSSMAGSEVLAANATLPYSGPRWLGRVKRACGWNGRK